MDAATLFLQPTNNLGCTDGYDHLPCTVYDMGLTSENTVTNSSCCTSTSYTTTAAGVYSIRGTCYATTASTTAYAIALEIKVKQSGEPSGHSNTTASCTIGTSESYSQGSPLTVYLASSTIIYWDTLTSSGSNTNGVWNIDLDVQRLK
jgi:hypothetical protein